jgi:CelD/BcsL family acetyltransferase involved in cellulose biosynthesis
MISRAERLMPSVRQVRGDGTRVLRTLHELDELAAPWNTIGEEIGLPTVSHAWVKACAAAFVDPDKLAVTVVRTPNAVAMAPLVNRDDGVSRLELLGVDEIGDPSDLVTTDASALARLAETLAHTGRPLHLMRIPAESPTVAALRRAYRGKGIVITRAHADYPWIPLDATWSCPESWLNPGRRSDVRRARRRAGRLGSLRLEMLSPTPGELAPLLEEAFWVEASGWKGRRGSAVLDDDARRTFFERYAFAAAARGTLRLGFLRIGGRAAAMQLGVESGERFWLLKIGYDETYRRCSPGMLLMIESLRYAAARGLRTYELLGTVEPWTSMWTSKTRACVSVRAYPASAHGIAALLAEGFRIGRRKLPSLARRALESALVRGDCQGSAPHDPDTVVPAR